MSKKAYVWTMKRDTITGNDMEELNFARDIREIWIEARVLELLEQGRALADIRTQALFWRDQYDGPRLIQWCNAELARYETMQ